MREGEVGTFRALFSRPAAFDPYVLFTHFGRVKSEVMTLTCGLEQHLYDIQEIVNGHTLQSCLRLCRTDCSPSVTETVFCNFVLSFTLQPRGAM